MPTYDYHCKACGHNFEKFQSMTAAPVKKCPKCGKSKVQRLIGTGAGLIFKGSGFYITDYRSEGYKTSEKAESGGGSAPAAESKDSGISKDSGVSKESGASKDAAPSKDSGTPKESKPAPEAPKSEKKSASRSAKKSKR